ncbi:MAG: copper chaperone PCu(A)C [Rhodanobacteraceae bacterium]
MRRSWWAAALFMVMVGTAATAATPSIQVEHAWIRWLPASLPCAGYATIVNDTDSTVRLTGASSPDYRDTMLMESQLAQDESSMVPVSHIDVSAHGVTKLVPGAYHIMLSNPTRTLKPGDTVPMTLRFSDGSSLQVSFSMLPANASGPSG